MKTAPPLIEQCILQDKVKKKKKTGHKTTEGDDGLAEIESGNATGEQTLQHDYPFKLTEMTQTGSFLAIS